MRDNFVVRPVTAGAVLTCLDVFGLGPRTKVRVAVIEAVGSRG